MQGLMGAAVTVSVTRLIPSNPLILKCHPTWFCSLRTKKTDSPSLDPKCPRLYFFLASRNITPRVCQESVPEPGLPPGKLQSFPLES